MRAEHDIVRLFAGADPRALDLDDDVCVLDEAGLVCSVDMLVEDVDFRLRTFSAEDVAWKALGAALSDLAAAGAQPMGFVSALALPELPTLWLERFAAALKGAASYFACPLLGGDLSRTPSGLSVSLTVFGRTARLLRRRQTRPDDVLLVSGELGAAAAGFEALERGVEAARLIHKQRRPYPQLALGAFLAAHEAPRGAMDLSDGLGADLPRFLAKGQGAKLDASALPIAEDTRAFSPDALRLAVSGGEDFELLTACAPELASKLIVDAFREGHRLTPIGRVSDDGTFMLDDAVLPPGFDHGKIARTP